MDWSAAGAGEIADLVRRRQASCVEVLDGILAHLEKVEPAVRAFLSLDRERAVRTAEDHDRRLAAGATLGPLFGVPIAFKDNLCTVGLATTGGSRILEGYIPPYSATVVNRMLDAGAIMVGKTNLDEFAMGSSTENSGYFPTHNPWDGSRVPGGSSGGSAAAVGARQIPLALGSDTGGSIRQPASFCGVVGLKPTYGRVSRYGLLAFASSLDQIGPLSRSVSDAALALQVLAGHDPRDSTSSTQPAPNFAASLRPDVKRLRIGLPREMFGQGVQPAVAECVSKAVAELSAAGAQVREVSMPSLLHTLPVYYILAPAEASSNLARYDGVEYGHRSAASRDTIGMYMASRDEGFGAEVKQRILIGTYALSAGYYAAYYLKAQQVRTLVRREFDSAFSDCDLLISPTAPTTAFRLGEKVQNSMEMKLGDVLTIPANIAGIPAISIPCGQADGLPVGMQIMARAFDEETMIRCAFTFEQATGHHLLRPQ